MVLIGELSAGMIIGASACAVLAYGWRFLRRFASTLRRMYLERHTQRTRVLAANMRSVALELARRVARHVRAHRRAFPSTVPFEIETAEATERLLLPPAGTWVAIGGLYYCVLSDDGAITGVEVVAWNAQRAEHAALLDEFDMTAAPSAVAGPIADASPLPLVPVAPTVAGTGEEAALLHAHAE